MSRLADKQKIRDKLYAAFSVNRLEHALFYNWNYGLRFELNTGGCSVEMFTSAYDRSRELLEHTFAKSNRIDALIRFCFSNPFERDNSKKMRRLKRCGFELPQKYLSEKYFVSELDEEGEIQTYYYEYLFEVEINSSNYLAILWAICSAELEIQPSVEIKCYFIDFFNQIIAHPYDDRGMDIVAIEQKSLSDLYINYHHWLLDYDLANMKSKFE